MKWTYLIVVLAVAGGLAYMVMKKPELTTDTPRGVADTFVDAALSGDLDKIRSLCQPSAVEASQRIAGEIEAAAPDPRSFKWQDTAARNPSLKAVTALFSGRILTIEMTEEGGEYKIAAIDLGQ